MRELILLIKPNTLRVIIIDDTITKLLLIQRYYSANKCEAKSRVTLQGDYKNIKSDCFCHCLHKSRLRLAFIWNIHCVVGQVLKIVLYDNLIIIFIFVSNVVEIVPFIAQKIIFTDT